jgi:hypothetical protein
MRASESARLTVKPLAITIAQDGSSVYTSNPSFHSARGSSRRYNGETPCLIAFAASLTAQIRARFVLYRRSTLSDDIFSLKPDDYLFRLTVDAYDHAWRLSKLPAGGLFD